MEDSVGVSAPFYCVVQSILYEPRIRFGRYGTGSGGQPAINLTLESKQISIPTGRALPKQAECSRCDANQIAVEDVDIDPDFFRKRNIP